MNIREQRHGAVTVLGPVGPIVQADAETFRERVARVISASLGRLVLDLSGVPFVDSAGLEALLDVSEELIESGHALRVCGATETIRETFDVTGLDGKFEHYADVNDATRSFL